MLDILGGALSAVAVDVGDDLAHVLQVIIVILILILLQQIDNDAAGLVACGLATVWRPANLQNSLLKVKPVWADIGCSLHLWLGLDGSFTLMACELPCHLAIIKQDCRCYLRHDGPALCGILRLVSRLPMRQLKAVLMRTIAMLMLRLQGDGL